MKIKLHRFLLPLLALGILSCQDESTPSTTAPSEPATLQLSARITTADGSTIPTSDSIHFTVKLKDSVHDTAVYWDAHSLDLGVVKEGDSIHFKATAWKWNTAHTQRTIAWTSKQLDTVAHASGNSTALVDIRAITTGFTLPAMANPTFTATSGVVWLDYKDSSITLAFSASAGISTVKVNGATVAPTNGAYKSTFKVGVGASVPVSVSFEDTLGAMAIYSYTLKRPATAAAVDSTSTAAFTSPSANLSIPNATTSLNVTVQTASTLKVDSVVLAGIHLGTTDSATWVGTVTGLKVGDSLLIATPYVRKKAGTPDSVKVKRLAAGEVDSSSTATFTTPSADLSIPNASSSLNVTVQTASALKVDSVVLAGIHLGTTDNVTWTGAVSGLKVGDSLLIATPYVGRLVGTPDSVKVKRLGIGSVDSTVTLAFVDPKADTAVLNGVSSLAVSFRSTSVLGIDSVVIRGFHLTKGTDTSLWSGTLTGLPVGKDTLKATAYAGKKTGSSPVRFVTRNSSDDSLQSIGMTCGSMDKTFTKSEMAYELALPADKDTVTLKPAVSHPNAVALMTLASGAPLTWPLKVTETMTVNILVTAQDTSFKQSYTVKLVPVPFAKPIVSMIAPQATDTSVANGTSNFTFQMSATSAHLKSVTIGGVAATMSNAVWSANVPLAVSVNTIYGVAVDSTGGRDSLTWKVTRAAPAAAVDAALVRFGQSAGTLLPAFDPAILNYTLTVDNAVTGVTFAPQARDSLHASVAPTGSAASLVVGTTSTVQFAVTGSDGSTIKTYTVNVNRQAVGTTITGTISKDTTLTLTKSPWTIGALGLTISKGYTLTIEPGVVIKVPVLNSVPKAITIKGTLVARGTEANPILFTQATGTSNWAYLLIDSTTTNAVLDQSSAYQSGSILQNVVIEGAGGTSGLTNNGALRINACAPLLENVTVRNNASNGVIAYNMTAQTIVMRNVTSSGNTGAGFDCGGCGGQFTGLKALNNTGHGFYSFGQSSIRYSKAQGNGGDGYNNIVQTMMLNDSSISNVGWGGTSIYGQCNGVNCLEDSLLVTGNGNGWYGDNVTLRYSLVN